MGKKCYFPNVMLFFVIFCVFKPLRPLFLLNCCEMLALLAYFPHCYLFSSFLFFFFNNEEILKTQGAHTQDKLKDIQGRLRRVLSSACESNCEDFVF